MASFMDALGFESCTLDGVKEHTYARATGNGDLRIVIYTSVTGHPANRLAAGRRKGRDAIRVTLFEGEQYVRGSKRVNRTQNWRLNMLKRIEAMEDSVI